MKRNRPVMRGHEERCRLMMDFALARTNMVKSQVQTNGVIDPRVIAALRATPREAYVPRAMRDFAYADKNLCVATDAAGNARYLMEPRTFGRMLQLAAPGVEDCVLNIGCATGYATAVLAALAQSVIAVEADEALSQAASANLEAQGVTNAVCVTGPLAAGWQREAPFDVIFVNGRIRCRPDALLAQLRDLGRLVAVYGDERIARIRLWTKRGGAISHVDEFDAAIPALPGFARSERVAA